MGRYVDTDSHGVNEDSSEQGRVARPSEDCEGGVGRWTKSRSTGHVELLEASQG